MTMFKGEESLFNGARLWQLSELFPKAYPHSDQSVGEGLIRNSRVGGVVYLTTDKRIASVYGTVPGREDVSRYRENDIPMEFLSTGMVLITNPNRVNVRPLAAHEITAKERESKLNQQIRIAHGPLPIKVITGVEFVVYKNFAFSKVTNGEGSEIPSGLLEDDRNIKLFTDTLEIAERVQHSYPDINVASQMSDLTHDEAIAIFEAT